MIGVYGGTFDPVHYGHLRTALEVSEIFGLKELRLIPCSEPPHRNQPLCPAALRLKMLRQGIANTPGLMVDTRELERKGSSYMVDTLKSIRLEIGETSLALFIGMDAFDHLTGWHQWEKLFKFAHIVVMNRPGKGINSKEMDSFFKSRITEIISDLRLKPNGNLLFQDVTQLDISATQIRRLVASGLDPQFLLPDSVIEIIRRNKLYTIMAAS